MRPTRILLPTLLALVTTGSVAEEIRACGGDEQWPPSSYYLPSSRQIGGISPDLLRRIVAATPFHLTIELVPWGRCLHEAEGNAPYQIVMGATYSRQREARFLYSHPFFAMTPGYFYLRHLHPDGVALESRDDLRRYRLCGLAGHNYAALGLKDGDVDFGPGNYASLIERMRHGRCDLFLENVEVVEGLRTQGEPELQSSDVTGLPIPGVHPTPIHFMISRKYPRSVELLTLINDGLPR